MFSSYIKSQTHSANLVQYISTREGVEFNTKELLGEVSEKQKNLIKEVVDKFAFLKELDEYKNYLKDSTKSNASKFLTESFSLIEDQHVNKEIYLKYISERPRVEKINTHGLFNSGGEADLQKEIQNIKSHKGPVWTHIISLKRDDAKRLGYDELKQWQLLLKTKIPKVAESMNIDLKNLVWNAAFHNEGHHPHVHLVMYSKDVKQGFLTPESIEKIKSTLMNEIYKEELLELKKAKSLQRDELKNEFEKELDKVYQNIVSKNYSLDTKLLDQFIELSKILPSKGKLVYGYQSKEIKEKIDKLVVDITKNKNMSTLYKKYLDYKKDIADYYSLKNEFKDSILKDKEFRPLQNMVLTVVKKLDGYAIELVEKKDEKPTLNKDKFEAIGNELTEIENSYSDKQQDAIKKSYEQVKEDNLLEEKQEFTEKSSILIDTMENKIMDRIKKSIENTDLKDILIQAHNGHSNGLNTFSKEILDKLCNSIIKRDNLDSYYSAYDNLCKEYSFILDKKPEEILEEGLSKIYNTILDFSKENLIKDDANLKLSKAEIVSNEMKNINELRERSKGTYKFVDTETVKNNNFQEEENSIRARMDNFFGEIEKKFITVLDKHMLTNPEFRDELSKIFEVKKEKLLSVEYEDLLVQRHIINAMDVLLNDSQLKPYYEEYLAASKDYSYLFKEPLSDVISPQLNRLGNEIISAVNGAFQFSGPYEDNTLEKDIHDIIYKGAADLKEKYILGPKVPVQYTDYSKGDQEEIKYLVKNIIFNIADLLYFSGKEEEMKKNNRLRLNRLINKHKREQDNSLHY